MADVARVLPENEVEEHAEAVTVEVDGVGPLPDVEREPTPESPARVAAQRASTNAPQPNPEHTVIISRILARVNPASDCT